nr:MAG TPA: hypothetical protein [Caudoviricetes sp.]
MDALALVWCVVLGHASFGRNAWEFVDCFSLIVSILRKITRQFNVPSGLCVGRASYVGLAGMCWLVCVSCLLDQSWS